MSQDLFRFVQFEFPWELGPPPGRYIVRDAGDEDALRVLVITVLGAPERRVLALHRVAAADPTVREVAAEQALVVRVGYGLGEEVAEGRWREAVEPGEAREPRVKVRSALRPQERLAALLGGRDAALACEELILRARADLDGGRHREAALQLRVALEAAIAELEAWREHGDMPTRIEELKTHRGAVGDAANAALRGGLDDEAIDAVYDAVHRIESALRARSAAGFS